MMLISSLQLIAGFFGLWKGGDFLISASMVIARRLKISSFLVGLTLLAFGTSAPELVVNLVATYQNKPDIIMGNILGSNLANTLLVLGLAGVLSSCQFPAKFLPQLGANVGLMAILAAAWMVSYDGSLIMTRLSSFILLIIFMGYLWWLVTKNNDGLNDDQTELNEMSKSRLTLTWLGGMVLLPLGGFWVVTGATQLAQALSISDALISLIAVALGTSLPELVTTVMAALRKESDLAVGNVIGSNIFNIGLIIGICGSIQAIQVPLFFLTDFYWCLGAVVLLGIWYFISKRSKLTSYQSMIMLALYITYCGLIWIRG